MARKTFLVLILALAVIAVGAIQAAQSPQIPIAGSAIPQFAQPLPQLNIGGVTGQPGIKTYVGSQPLEVHLCEFEAKVLPPGTFLPGVQPTTRVWGYIVGTGCPNPGAPEFTQDTYLGPVIVNTRNIATEMKFVNDLGSAATTQVLAYKYSVDQTLHWADPLNAERNDCNMNIQAGTPPTGTCAENYAGPIPAAVHLHGGEVPPELDGGPDAWVTSDGLVKGHGYYSFAGAPANGFIYKYPNTQEASPIWFHDHVLGATRLNVYAGLAGGYIVEDPAIIPIDAAGWVSTGTCASNCLPANLPGSTAIVPVILQDRMFDTNGQLFFPGDSAGGVLSSLNPEHPYWVPEFVGDTIVVNGKAWPFLDVQPKRYRFLFLNGSNARTYEMNLQAPMWVIGTDGGYVDTPVAVKKLVMQPGERYEVIIDFAGFAGKNLILTNTAKTPYPAGKAPQGVTLGRIMQFRVQKPAAPIVDASYNPALGTSLRPGTQALVRLVNSAAGTLAAGVTAAKTRALTLNEVMGMPMTVIDPVTGVLTPYPGGPLEILVNNTKWAGTDRPDFTPISVGGITTYYSELPQEGDTEVWEIVNLTADAHPIHLHLVQFQLMNRQGFNKANYPKTYAAAFGTDLTLPAPPAGCLAGVFCPGFGPPLNYDPSVASGNKYGGNPDVTPFLQGPVQTPDPQEAGWKDTVIALPGQVTRIAVRWAPTSELVQATVPGNTLYFPFDPSDGLQHGYVWHCHIIDHEDNEMMRPDVVQLNPFAPPSRPLVKGVAY
jgi:FtsP/CotA-like multicopper oxidase with cupredoxin domain